MTRLGIRIICICSGFPDAYSVAKVNPTQIQTEQGRDYDLDLDGKAEARLFLAQSTAKGTLDYIVYDATYESHEGNLVKSIPKHAVNQFRVGAAEYSDSATTYRLVSAVPDHSENLSNLLQHLKTQKG